MIKIDQIKDEPNKCVYCGSDDITANDIEFQDTTGFLFRTVKCHDCEKLWGEEFIFSKIVEIES